MPRILIMDEIEAAPGQTAILRERYASVYAPAAKRCGMTLEGGWETAVADLPERNATFFFVWSVPDIAAWWALRLCRDPDKLAWWRANDTLIARRRRRFLTDVAAIDAVRCS